MEFKTKLPHSNNYITKIWKVEKKFTNYKPLQHYHYDHFEYFFKSLTHDYIYFT